MIRRALALTLALALLASPVAAQITVSPPNGTITAAVPAFTVTIPSNVLVDAAAWPQSLARIGLSTTSSVTQGYGLNVQLNIGATSATADYEKAGILSQVTTADSSNTFITDAVGVDGRGSITTGNVSSHVRVWGGYFQGTAPSGSDGVVYGAEIAASNDGTDQASVNTGTSKYGLHLVAAGAVASTAAIYINNGPVGTTWHKGIYANPATIGSGTNDSFIELLSLFRVKSTGDLLIGVNKFTVAGATGNTTVAGTLGVTGTLTMATPFTLGATSVTSTGTQLNYLSAATGTTGTTSTNVVFSTSPTLVTPAIGAATGTSLNLTSNLTASGNVTGGQSAGSNLMLINGGNTNSGDGALFVLRNNSSNILLIGNKSAIDSGAYSATAGLWSANSWNWYVNGSTTASMSLSTTGVLAMVATVDATSTTTGTITNPGGMSVNKRVWMDGLSTATGTPSSICRNANEVTVNAALTCTVSSLIFKHDFVPIEKPALPVLMAMDPGSFYYNDNGDRQRLGFAAEYMQRLDPRLADGYDADGHARSIDQNAILAVTVKALQELAAEVSELRAR